MRAAIYWAPGLADPLSARGNAWLGRDADSDMSVSQPDVPGIAEFTAAPRHYGFHATLRPPMRLATSWNEFRESARRIAAATRRFAMPDLRLETLDGFLALTLCEPCPAMQALADLCVRETEPHRAPAPPEELARRRAADLSPRQERLLQDWGYPYVMQEWQFHLTLTRRLAAAELALVAPRAVFHFGNTLTRERTVEAICLFTESESGFRIAERIMLA